MMEANGDGGTGAAGAAAAGGQQEDHSFSEEQLLRLAMVRDTRLETGKLQEIQAQLELHRGIVREENSVMEELRKEKAELVKEQAQCVAWLQQVREDLAATEKGLSDTLEARDEAQAQLTAVIEGQYTPQKELVDKLRTSIGLTPLPSFQEVEEKQMAIYLEKRRKSWKEAEELQLKGRPAEKRQKLEEASAAGGPAASPAPPKRKRGRPKGSKTKAKAPAKAKAATTGRKRGRPRKVRLTETEDSQEWTPP
mmetsp:Transcript_12353/g.49516  ORF Transcript_12353/g.49516 Transcript_12353/m.49516 type:complete len:252 (-) Transcript_12353:94-849(-)